MLIAHTRVVPSPHTSRATSLKLLERHSKKKWGASLSTSIRSREHETQRECAVERWRGATDTTCSLIFLWPACWAPEVRSCHTTSRCAGAKLTFSTAHTGMWLQNQNQKRGTYTCDVQRMGGEGQTHVGGRMPCDKGEVGTAGKWGAGHATHPKQQNVHQAHLTQTPRDLWLQRSLLVNTVRFQLPC